MVRDWSQQGHRRLDFNPHGSQQAFFQPCLGEKGMGSRAADRRGGTSALVFLQIAQWSCGRAVARGP